MSDRWFDAPRVRPFVCAVCRRGGAEAGPYWESSFHYADPVTGAALRLYLCRQCLVNVFQGQGSPFVEPLLEARAALQAAEDERDLALITVEELRAQLDEVRPDGTAGLAEQVAAALEDRWGTPPASWRDRAQGVR